MSHNKSLEDRRSELWAYIALLVLAFIWGLHGVVGKSLEARMNPLSLTVWRYTFTTICYSLIWAGSIRRIFSYDWRTLVQLALAGVLIVVIYPLFFYQSLPFLTPIESLVIMNTSPLLAALMAFGFLRERINAWGWAGIAVSFGGIALLIRGESSFQGTLYGFALCAVGALAFAGYVVLTRRLMQTVALKEMLTGTTVIGTICLWLLAAVQGELQGVWVPIFNLNGSGWFELLFVVLFVSVLGYALNAYGAKRLPGGIAAAVSLYPQPAFAALFQWVWFGLVPTVWSVASALLVFGGVALSKYQGQAKAPKPKPVVTK
ncbi:DMT family transporter [Paenibacillus alkalitolerans]|uniref:DMT family transporter n=1 Tax=Paenibacillus alkalitolerans TaxID=2799335 RepID=UPI0018F39503|nr:DMT family transporter [Paenibacillus alkalitolerans]